MLVGEITPMTTTGTAEQTARKVHQSTAVEWLARLGLASRGLVWLVVGLLALSVVLGHDEKTDRGGALRSIADKPLGEPVLVVLVVGFLGYALWRALSAAVGHRKDDGAKRTGKRVLSGAKALLYTAFAVSTTRFLTSGGRTGGDRTQSTTAKVLASTGGRTAVFVVGAVVVLTGLGIALRAARQKHDKRLESYRLPDRLETPASVIGIVGLVGRGLVIALVGSFLVKAAYQFNAEEARGLDAALLELSQQTYGRGLLLLAAVGLVGYGIWSFVEAAYRSTD